MKNITTNIPDTLLRQAQTIAEREELSLDQFIALALASQVSVWDTRASFADRAKHGDWQNAHEVLAKAPNNEPEAHDQF
jgi:hypothetical protein